MINRISGKLCIVCLLVSLISTANATLLSRLGGQAVYDTDLDITWLADANASAGSIYDDGGSTTDGAMTWANANAWAASLNIGGFTDWRLPTADPACGILSCTESEMGHLFYNELGGTAGQSILTSSDPDLALFSNIQPSTYWSDTNISPHETWVYQFVNGRQLRFLNTHQFFAWAVRSGDVSAVPIPASIWLFVTGLFGLIGASKRKAH